MANDMRLKVLLVEDNPADARLTLEILRESHLGIDLELVDDGEKARQFLRREEPYDGVGRPDLVLLDLNLPRRNGREVLSEMKQDPSLRSIPVIIFTTSDAEQDILDCYQKHANAYLTKPVSLDDYMDKLKSVAAFWLGHACLPSA